MKSIREKQDEIVADFKEMGDDFVKYSYLINLSGMLPDMDESMKNNANMVGGCQSRVWLDIKVSGGRMYFNADSDTMIIKGILYLLREILSGQYVKAVSDANIDFLDRADIMVTFESDRRKGIGYIIKKIKETASSSLYLSM